MHQLAVVEWLDLRHALESVGFGGVETWPSYGAEAPSDPDGPRIIFTAFRPSFPNEDLAKSPLPSRGLPNGAV